MARMNEYRTQLILMLPVLAVFLWSGINVQDTRLTWVLETIPVMVVLPLLLWTARSFPLTTLAYTLIALHAMVLMVGGHYSYAKVPLGFWMEDWFGWTRNNYDKIGHLMQGFTPAIIVREILVRRSPVKGGGWLTFMSISIPLAFSALYELIEWGVALLSPNEAEAFLGIQGYFWDTQSDMLMCLLGSILAVMLLTRLHDSQLARSAGE